jgi:hypothetical protein
MNTAAMLALLEIYFEAFAEHDHDRRIALLARCFTEDGEIDRGRAPAKGRNILEHGQA